MRDVELWARINTLERAAELPTEAAAELADLLAEAEARIAWDVRQRCPFH